MTRSQLLENVRELPRSEQIELMLDMWEAISPTNAELPLTEEHKEQLDRRLAADQVNPVPAEDWPVLREKLFRNEF